ncbi:MAG: hypothetical protein VCA74_08920 [Deltaproteobacteria bacterium]
MRPGTPTILPAVVMLVTLAACGGGKEAVEVVIPLERNIERQATIIVDYSQAKARPLLAGGEPACASILPHVKARFTDDGSGKLTIAIFSKQPLTAPLDVVVCRMTTDSRQTSSSDVAAALAIATASDGGRLSRKKSTAASESPSRNKPARPDKPTKHIEPAGPAGGDPSLLPSVRQVPAPDQRREQDKDSTVTLKSGQSPPPGKTQATRQQPGPAAKSSSDGRDGTQLAPTLQQSDPQPGTVQSPQATPTPDRAQESQVHAYSVTIGVISNSGILGALQLEILHTGSSGNFVGKGESVDCSPLVNAAMVLGNNQRGGRLSYALVDLNGFSTPTSVVSCTFKTSEALFPSSFDVRVVDATDPDGSPVGIDAAITGVLPLN